MPPVMPAPKFTPTSPSTTAVPPVMYSQPFEPTPSTTVSAPELRTAKRSPALPEANSLPAVAPYRTVLPTIALCSGTSGLETVGFTTMVPPDRPLPT
jgi:hypothetical protein